MWRSRTLANPTVEMRVACLTSVSLVPILLGFLVNFKALKMVLFVLHNNIATVAAIPLLPMEEDSWENWISHLGLAGEDLPGQCHMMNPLDEEKFLRGMAQQQGLSLESVSSLDRDSHRYPSPTTFQNSTATATATVDCGGSSADSSNSTIVSQPPAAAAAAASSPPRAYTLSFENSTVELAAAAAAAAAKPSKKEQRRSAPLSPKRKVEKLNEDQRENHGSNKKVRSSSETLDHIMAERKRRQELTERFIALSAIIPGLKKIDKAYILREAINYVKQLQERVKELENENERTSADSVIFIKKFRVCANETTSFDSCNRSNTKALPEVQARVLKKEVLIGIHCEKQKDIVLKIVSSLQNVHLSLATSSVLPFGTSALKVTIVAQMGDKYCMTVNDLVRNLRRDLLK